jgi:predicted RNA-binding protein associated with RNAse of E/G family
MKQPIKFENQLIDIKYATKKQVQQEHWHIEGILKSKSNQKFKFDLSPIIKFKKEDYGKVGHFKSKADKIVFDFENTWVLIDTEELHEFIKQSNQKDLYLDILLKELSWNIIINK